jgi:hypothetical protein
MHVGRPAVGSGALWRAKLDTTAVQTPPLPAQPRAPRPPPQTDALHAPSPSAQPSPSPLQMVWMQHRLHWTPVPQPASARPELFSEERALAHVRALAGVLADRQVSAARMVAGWKVTLPRVAGTHGRFLCCGAFSRERPSPLSGGPRNVCRSPYVCVSRAAADLHAAAQGGARVRVRARQVRWLRQQPSGSRSSSSRSSLLQEQPSGSRSSSSRSSLLQEQLCGRRSSGRRRSSQSATQPRRATGRLCRADGCRSWRARAAAT